VAEKAKITTRGRRGISPSRLFCFLRGRDARPARSS